MLDRHVMGSALGGCASALVVDLRRCDVTMTEQFLDLRDLYAGVKKERGGRAYFGRS